MIRSIEISHRRPLYPREGYRVDIELGNRTAAANDYAAMCLKRARRYETDESQPDRLLARQCRYCYYLRGTGQHCGGHDAVNCRQCDSPMMIDSGSEREVCRECSDRYGLCRRCGGDVDGNERRRKLARWPK